MVDIIKYKNKDDKPSWFDCETCRIWQKEAKTLKAKLDKSLQRKVTFAIGTSKYDMPSHNPYIRYNFVENGSNSKSTSSHNLYCHYCCKMGYAIAKCKFMRLFFPKGAFQWLPKCNQGFINSQGPNEDWVPSTFR